MFRHAFLNEISQFLSLFYCKPVPSNPNLLLLGGGGRPPCALGKNVFESSIVPASADLGPARSYLFYLSIKFNNCTNLLYIPNVFTDFTYWHTYWLYLITAIRLYLLTVHTHCINGLYRMTIHLLTICTNCTYWLH